MTSRIDMTKLNGYFKYVVWLIPLLVAGLLAFTNLKGDVQALETKVDVQYEAILRELQHINNRLDRFEG